LQGSPRIDGGGAIRELDGKSLILVAENDFDSDGLALSDEFSDAIAAHVSGGFDGPIRVVSVVEIPNGR